MLLPSFRSGAASAVPRDLTTAAAQQRMTLGVNVRTRWPLGIPVVHIGLATAGPSQGLRLGSGNVHQADLVQANFTVKASCSNRTHRERARRLLAAPPVSTPPDAISTLFCDSFTA